MGYHIPDIPSTPVSVIGESSGPSTESTRPLHRRRNAMISIRAGVSLTPLNNEGYDRHRALLQFQDELRQSGQLGEIPVKEPPSIRRASDVDVSNQSHEIHCISTIP